MTSVHAQEASDSTTVLDIQEVAAEAAKTISEAPEVIPQAEAPRYWNHMLMTNLNMGQTSLKNWAAGGDNTVSFQGFVDGTINYKKDDMFWENRLQLDYGFLYASSKPIVQKSTDRVYLESKWGCKTESMRDLYFSANFDFKSQFSTGYDYNTPSSLVDANGNELVGSDLKKAWKYARVVKSGLFAPAYTNLAFGMDYKPTTWLSVNFAPIAGAYVIVMDEYLRKNYSMNPKRLTTETMLAQAEDALAAAQETGEKASIEEAALKLGNLYQGARFELGAQLKMDAAVSVNDNFKYSTQVVLFYNYLGALNVVGGKAPRINWDNRVDWKLAKYFSLTLITNLIYDDTIMITTLDDPEPRARVQFKESLAFGFTYTIASKN